MSSLRTTYDKYLLKEETRNLEKKYASPEKTQIENKINLLTSYLKKLNKIQPRKKSNDEKYNEILNQISQIEFLREEIKSEGSLYHCIGSPTAKFKLSDNESFKDNKKATLVKKLNHLIFKYLNEYKVLNAQLEEEIKKLNVKFGSSEPSPTLFPPKPKKHDKNRSPLRRTGADIAGENEEKKYRR